MVGDRQQCRQRSQPDQLRLGELDTGRACLCLDGLPDPPERGDGEVEQVHRDLGAVGLLQPEAVGLDRRQPTTGLADGPGDPPGELDVIDARLML